MYNERSPPFCLIIIPQHSPCSFCLFTAYCFLLPLVRRSRGKHLLHLPPFLNVFERALIGLFLLLFLLNMMCLHHILFLPRCHRSVFTFILPFSLFRFFYPFPTLLHWSSPASFFLLLSFLHRSWNCRCVPNVPQTLFSTIKLLSLPFSAAARITWTGPFKI